jgi:hypothetical protein
MIVEPLYGSYALDDARCAPQVPEVVLKVCVALN